MELTSFTEPIKIFRTTDQLTVWNYFKVIEHNDLRYLLILDDYNNLPEQETIKKIVKKRLFKNKEIKVVNFDYKELSDIWEDITYQFKEGVLNLDMMRIKYKMWQSYHEWIFKGKDRNYNKWFAKYRLEVDRINKEFCITDNTIAKIMMDGIDGYYLSVVFGKHKTVYNSFTTLYEELRKEIKYNELLRLRPYLIESIEMNSKITYDYMEELTDIEQILNREINDKTCTIEKYMMLRKKAIKKAQDNVR